MLYYLCACICSILSYDLARSLTTFHSSIQILNQNKVAIKVVQMFWYCDIVILIIMFFSGFFIKKKYKINIYNPNFYFKNKNLLLLLILPILSSNCKSFLSSSIPGNIIITYSLMTPLIVCVLSLLLLKEKPPKNYIYSLLIGFFGFVITQYGAIEKLDNANILLIGYVFLNAASVIGMRWAVKKRNKIEGIFFENFIYAAQGVVLFSIFGGFSFKILFSWQVILVSLFAIIHHVFVIIGTQKSKYVSNIILIDFAKVIVAYLSCFVFFDKKPITIEIIGASMIVFALFLIKNKK